jgi:hypothetical protein
MPVALFAGIPQRSLARLKTVLAAAQPRIPDWTFRYLVTQKGPNLQLRDRKAIHAEAERLGSLHVLGLSATRDRKDVADAIRPYFRFRWFDHTLLSLLNNPDPSLFVDATVAVLEEERAWEDRIMPKGFSHALVLPEPCFKCSNAFSDMWQKAEAYGATDSVPAAERAIAAFEDEYHQRIQFQTRGQALRQQTKWMDARGLVFDENGARHGAPPVPRSWKLSYRLIDGFHYDISKLNKDRFEIVDQAGTTHRVLNEGYINIDAHGNVR